MQPETDFTLHRIGNRFIKEANQHKQKLTESGVAADCKGMDALNTIS